jgi:hypothetical protein
MRWPIAPLCLLMAAAPALALDQTLKSGVEVGGEMKSFEPIHLAGPDKGKRTCPVC